MFKSIVEARRNAVYGSFVALVVMILAALPAAAQLSGTGAISGTVTDSTGALIPNAIITVTAVDTNVKTVRTSTGAGDFSITPLIPGVYSVSVTAKGFEQYVQQNVTVDALATVGLTVKLTVGQESQTVTISAAPPALDTTDATLGAVMDNEMYSSLPLLMGQGGNNDQRRATDFEYLMPGVQGNYTSNNSTDNSGIVNGSGPAGGVSEIYIEGVNLPEADQVGDPRFTWSAIGVDAVNQFQVQTAGYAAQYAGQGVENYSIKSGGNQIHGSIYEFLRNTVLDTWSFTAKIPTINNQGVTVPGGIKPKEIQNEFGIVLSGPIIKDKLFLFGNYGQYRNQNGPKYSNITLPTAAMIGYTQTGTALGYADFTGYAASTGYHIYDPASQIPNCAGTAASPCTRTQFMGMKNGVPTPDVIPGNRISAAAANVNKFLVAYEPLTNQTAYSNNYAAGQPFGLANWYDTERLDYNQSQRNQIAIIVAFGRQASTGTNSVGSGQLGPPFNTSQSYHPVTNVDVVKDVFTFSPHLVNQFAVGYGRYQSVSVTPDQATQYQAATLGLTGNQALSGSSSLPPGQANGGFPEIQFSGGPSGTAPGTQAGYAWNSKVNNTYTVTDNVNWVINKHNLTLGGQYVVAQFNYYKALGPTGPADYSFSNSQTGAFSNASGLSTSLNASSGSPVASYILGGASSASILDAEIPGLGTRWHDPSFWGQDDWKVNQKLTLNLGLRWDIFPSIHEAHNLFSYLNPKGANSVTGNLGTLEYAGNSISGASCNCQTPSPVYYKNIAPRIGMAFAADDKTVFRGSFDVAYARGDWTSGSQSGSPSTVGYTPGATAPAGLSSAPALYWDNTQCASGNADGVNCGFTGSFSAPTPPAGGTSLAEYLTTETQALGNGGSGTVTYFDPYLGSRTPEFINFTFGMQRSITKGMTITATYVGSQGHFISASKAIGARNNELPSSLAALAGYNVAGGVATPCNSATTCTAPLLTQKATTGATGNLALAQSLGFTPPNPYNPANATYYASNTVNQYYQPFPQYSGVSDTTSFVGNTNFNALEIVLRQRASHGLDLMVNYTYSKSIDDVGTFRVGDNNRLDRSLSVTDQPENLNVSAVYVSPYGKRGMKSEHFLVNALASNWSVSGIYVYHSGNPLVSTGSGCGGSGILNQCMPSLVLGQQGRQYRYNKDTAGNTVTAANYSSIQYVNPAAFTVATAGSSSGATMYGTTVNTSSIQATYVGNGPQLYVPGNAPRVGALNIFGQGFYDMDMSLSRTFPIYEKVNLQLRADMVNVTNHVVFATPSGAANGAGLGEIGGLNGAYNPRDIQISGRINW